jgi:hypothetical protein
LQDVKAHYESKLDEKDKAIQEMATTSAHLMSLKEQIKKKVEEETVAYADLLEIIGFLEKKFPAISSIDNPPAHAPVDVENRRQHHDELLTSHEIRPHPLDFVTPRGLRTERLGGTRRDEGGN